MSLFTFLVSDCPLEEVDYSGITEITVRELKKSYPISDKTPVQSWHSMDDDTRILHAPDASAFGELVISFCNNLPYDLAFYTEKEYAYSLDGNWKGKFLTDFVDYIKTHIKASENVQLLIFWAGDGEQKLIEREISIEEIQPNHLEQFKRKKNIRIQFV